MMKRVKLNVVLFLLIILLSACTIKDREYPLPDVSEYSLKGNTFDLVTIDDNFKFVVFSHAYGNPSNHDDIPATSLITHMFEVNALEADFMFSLGDMMRKTEPNHIENLQKYLLSEINVPVFNAVGNHDVSDRAVYARYFGPTYYSFKYGNALFIVLDTEIDRCSILGDQKELLDEQLDNAMDDDSIDHVFIMMHKVLFLDSVSIAGNSNYKGRPNDSEIFEGNNFDDILSTIIIPFAEKKSVYMFAGDVGAFGGNMSPFYRKYNSTKLYSYAAGIGDSEDDVIFIVENNGKNVQVQPYRLSDGTILKLNDFNQDYWENYDAPKYKIFIDMKDKSVECVLGMCRFAKVKLNMRCRYFLLLISGVILLTLLAVSYIIYRNKRNSRMES